MLALPKAKYVFVAMTWDFGSDDLFDPNGKVLDNRDNRMLIAALDDLVDRLKKAGKQVVLVGPLAQPDWDVASIL